jgi:glycine/D-amino acid oxidase-like deaminating enzyme
MERDADAVVVGAGIVGCATAYFLARRGARVVVVERGPVPGEQSRKNWGFVRQQGRDPLELPLMMEANRLWRGLERELGADVEWVQGGNLALAADEKRLARFEEWLSVAREFGLDTRLLRARDLEAVVPGLAGAWVGGMHTPGDGHADPEKTTDAFARAAVSHGASLHLECAVQGVTTRAGAVGQRRDGSFTIAAGGALDHDVTLDSLRQLRFFLPNYWKDKALFRFHVGRPLLASLAATLPGSAGRRRPLVWDRGLEPPPNPAKVRRSLVELQRVLPSLPPLGIARSWAGYLDAAPDLVPMLGESRRSAASSSPPASAVTASRWGPSPAASWPS